MGWGLNENGRFDADVVESDVVLYILLQKLANSSRRPMLTFPHFHGKEKQSGGARTLRENPAHAAEAAAEKNKADSQQQEEPICRPVRQSQSVRQVSAPIPGRIGLSGLGRRREERRLAAAQK